AATPLRDARYLAARVRTAQVVADPASSDTVAFGSTVTFRRDDGRVQKYRIVGEDEADPKAGSISFVSPVARSLMGKAVGDVVGTSGKELEIISISSPSPTKRSRCSEWPLCARSIDRCCDFSPRRSQGKLKLTLAGKIPTLAQRLNASFYFQIGN